MTSKITHKLTRLLVALSVLLVPAIAGATPVLQVYVEGASYNTSTESWEFQNSDGTAEVVILAKLAPDDTLSDVNLVVAYGASNTSADISLTEVGGGSVSSTLSTALTPLGLSPHGIYGSGTSYMSFDLGDFSGSALDSVINMTDPGKATNGDVRAYTLAITNVSGSIHLDAFGTDSSGKIKFAPYSHDAEIVSSVPELSPAGTAPAAALVLGFMFIMGTRRRKIMA